MVAIGSVYAHDLIAKCVTSTCMNVYYVRISKLLCVYAYVRVCVCTNLSVMTLLTAPSGFSLMYVCMLSCNFSEHAPMQEPKASELMAVSNRPTDKEGGT